MTDMTPHANVKEEINYYINGVILRAKGVNGVKIMWKK